MKELCGRIRDDHRFELFIIGVIVLAGVLVGLETNQELVAKHGKILHAIDNLILGIFILEIVIKLIAEWPKPGDYFRNGWNVFDFCIVAVCLLPSSGAWVTVIRLARILRAVRLITQIPKLQILVGALLKSLPSMGYVSLLLGLHFYVYAVMATFLFRGNDPGHFGSLGLSMLSLFRVVTLEDWTDVMYTAMLGSDVYAAQGPIPVGPDPQAYGWWGVLYFTSFVVVGAMVMINLFVGVMVTSLSEAQAESLRSKLDIDEIEQHEAQLEKTVENLETQLTELRRLIQSQKGKT
ncbi:MAG: ion transporter [Limisphaerales bacterium]